MSPWVEQLCPTAAGQRLLECFSHPEEPIHIYPPLYLPYWPSVRARGHVWDVTQRVARRERCDHKSEAFATERLQAKELIKRKEV